MSDTDTEAGWTSADSEDDFMGREGGSGMPEMKPYCFEPQKKRKLDSQKDDDDSPSDPDDEPRSVGPVDRWCTCQNCVAWPTNEENTCCQESPRIRTFLNNVPDDDLKTVHKCVTDHRGFQLNCLEPLVLRNAYFHFRTEQGRLLPHAEKEQFRYTAYRQFIRMVYGFLGKEMRVPLPSCAYKRIRSMFPDSGGTETYTGFLYNS